MAGASVREANSLVDEHLNRNMKREQTDAERFF